MQDLPRSGTEPVSPALASGSLTTGPPGKPLENILFWESSVALPHRHLPCFTKPFNRVMSQVLHNSSCLWAPRKCVFPDLLCSLIGPTGWNSGQWTWALGTLCLGRHSRFIRLWPVLPWVPWLFIFPVYSFVVCVPKWEYKASWGEEFGLRCSLQNFWTRLCLHVCGCGWGEHSGRKRWREINNK